MRYLLTGRQPAATSILLVESGSRGILERMLPPLQRSWGAGVPVDLVSCFATLPKGFPPETRLYRVSDYRGPEGRGKLYSELAKNRYSHIGIVCSAEPLMTKWKWMLALRLPAKVFMINENADYFWLDRTHSTNIWTFVLLRTGLAVDRARYAFWRSCFLFRSHLPTCYSMQQQFMPEELYAEVEI